MARQKPRRVQVRVPGRNQLKNENSPEALNLQKLENSPEEFLLRLGRHKSRPEKLALQNALSNFSKNSIAGLCEVILYQTTTSFNSFEKLRQGEDPPEDLKDSEAASEHRSPLSGDGSQSEPGPSLTPQPKHRKRRKANDTLISHVDQMDRDLELQQIRSNQTFSSKGGSALAHAVTMLRGCATCVQVGISAKISNFSSEAMLPSVKTLHDALVYLETFPALQAAVGELCEMWWHRDLPGKECVIVQFLPFLLNRSLQVGRKGDVKRVYALREALTMFDFQDVSIEDLKRMLIMAAISPSYLRVGEGRRFLSFLFGLDEQLVKELIVIVRAQIPFGRRSVLDAYGEVLYRAWKAATGPCLHEVEHAGVQGLIEGSLHASTKALSAAARTVLEGFTSQRTKPGVEAMLFRLHEPLIFRALQVANSNVRRNSLLLFVDVFPLQDPKASKVEKEALLEKQFTLLEKLLLDECPEVRTVTVEAVCRILRLFWEIVPSGRAVSILKQLVDKLARDASNPTVRLAVPQGLVYLLENSQSHAVLQAMLPRLFPLLNDADLRVRVAAADLLLVIKESRAIPFQRVTRLDLLLPSLATDHSSIATRLTRLLLPSYFPSQIPVADACLRCLALVKRSPEAGARFCEFALAEGASPSSLLELIKAFCNVIMASASVDIEMQEGALSALATVCQSMSVKEEWKTAIGEILNGQVLTELVTCAPSSKARSTVMRLGSFLPLNKEVPKLVEYCGKVIMEGAVMPTHGRQEVRAVQSFVLTWGGFDDLLQALVASLQCSSAEPSPKSVQKPYSCVANGRKRNKRIKEPSSKSSAKGTNSPHHLETPSEVRGSKTLGDQWIVALRSAWQIENLLAEDKTREAIFLSGSSQELFSQLRTLAQATIENPSSHHGNPTIAVSPVLAYVKFAMYVALEQSSEGCHPPGSAEGSGRKANMSTATPTRRTSAAVLETVMEELVGWTTKMLEASASAHKYVPKTPVQKSQSRSKLKASSSSKKLREPLSECSPNIHKGTPKSASHFVTVDTILQITRIIAAVLQLASDAVALDLVPTQSTQELLSCCASKAFNWTLAIVNANPYLEDSSKRKEFELCVRGATTHAAKLTHTFTKSAVSDMGSVIAHSLLDVVTVHKVIACSSSSSIGHIFGPLLWPWLPDLLIAVASDSEKGHPTATMQPPQPWVAQLASIAYETMEESKQKSASDLSKERTNHSENVLGEASKTDVNYLDIIVGLLQRGELRVLEGFAQLFLRFARHCLKLQDYTYAVGALQLVCRRLFSSESPDRISLGTSTIADLEAAGDSLGSTLDSISRKGEVHKNLDTCRQLVSELLQHKAL